MAGGVLRLAAEGGGWSCLQSRGDGPGLLGIWAERALGPELQLASGGKHQKAVLLPRHPLVFLALEGSPAACCGLSFFVP